MRKLKLQVEELVVDSFDVVDHKRKAPGTVRGHEDTVDETVCNYSHEFNVSCQMNCSNDCDPDTIFAKTCDGPTCNSPGCILPE
jgi:hypothetical protein